MGSLAPPAIVTLVRYPDVATYLSNRPPQRQKDLRLTQAGAEWEAIISVDMIQDTHCRYHSSMTGWFTIGAQKLTVIRLNPERSKSIS